MIKLRAAALVVRRSITMSPTLAPHSTTGEAADGGYLVRLPGVFPHKATNGGACGPVPGVSFRAERSRRSRGVGPARELPRYAGQYDNKGDATEDPDPDGNTGGGSIV